MKVRKPISLKKPLVGRRPEMIKDAENVQLTPDEPRLFTAEFYFEVPQNETLPEGMVKKLVDDYREEILNGPDEIEKVQFNRVYTKPENDTDGPDVVVVEIFLDAEKGADTIPNHIGLKTEVSNQKHPTDVPLIGINIVGRPHDWILDLVTTVAMTTQEATTFVDTTMETTPVATTTLVETTQPQTTPEITTVEVTTEEETTEEPIPPTPEPVPTTTMVTTETMTTTPEVTTTPMTTTPEVTTRPETTPEPTTTPVVTTTTTPEPTTPEITTVEVTTDATTTPEPTTPEPTTPEPTTPEPTTPEEIIKEKIISAD